MSADRDRGIRRVKQKRAKTQKKAERQQRRAGAAQGKSAAPSTRPPA
jgi:hypothetical protein